jgi:CBS domain-containing protein
MLKDLISHKLVSIEIDAKVSDVARLMTDHDVGAVLVVDDLKKPLGIITDRDIVVRCVAESLPLETTIEKVFTESCEVAKESEGLYDAIKKMRSNQVRRIPVVDDSGKAVGLISFGDVVSILGKELAELSETVTPGEKPLKKIA